MISFMQQVLQRMLRERSLMPPKVKFSKEAIIGTALQLVREEGMSSLTARALAEKLELHQESFLGNLLAWLSYKQRLIGAAEMVVVGVYSQGFRR